MIPQKTVQEILDTAKIEDIVGDFVNLKKAGANLKGLCPFHNEKTGSFSVNGEEGLYHCFGCKKSGDAITFVREIDHLDFPEAIEVLARRAGISLRYTDSNEGAVRNKRKELTNHVNRAADFYHERLLEHSDAGQARGYLRSLSLIHI